MSRGPSGLETLREDDDRSFRLSPSTLTTAGLLPSNRPPPSAYNFRAQMNAYESSSQYSTSSHCPSLTSASTAPSHEIRHYSVQSHSSTSSSHSAHKDHESDYQINFDHPDFTLNRSGTIGSDYALNRSGTMMTYDAGLNRTGTMISSNRDAMSISSGSTGTSSKKMAKLEKQM